MVNVYQLIQVVNLRDFPKKKKEILITPHDIVANHMLQFCPFAYFPFSYRIGYKPINMDLK